MISRYDSWLWGEADKHMRRDEEEERGEEDYPDLNELQDREG